MTYTIRTPFLFWFGVIALGLALAIAVSAWGNWLAIFVMCSLFGGCGAAMLFMSAHVSGDQTKLIVGRPHKRSILDWNDVVSAQVGGGNLVFKTKTGRVVAPSFEFWAGKDKRPLIALIDRQLRERGIDIKASMAVAFKPDDR